MRAASINLIGAGDLARASQLAYREEISVAIDNLEQQTTSSTAVLRQFDNGMMYMISDMNIHLNISLREMQRIVIETEAELSHSNSEILGGSTLTALGFSELENLKSGLSNVNTQVFRHQDLTTARKEERKGVTRSIWDKLFEREVGIRSKLNEDIIDIIIQIETLNEMTLSCMGAQKAFLHALDILRGLDDQLRRMGRTMSQIRGMDKEPLSFDVNRWEDLITLTRALPPFVDGFQETGNYYKNSQTQAANEWKAKLHECSRTGGKNCVFGDNTTSLPPSQTATQSSPPRSV
ncbi:hypothetical protein IFR05_003014 [Cadophora sp. M221]|nr:hypothetical protein IFR05_003014 [Cadophora sp. M221]